LAHIERANGKSYAATAQNASREGTALAANIIMVIDARTTEPFDYEDSGSLAALGCRTAVAKVFGFKIAGFLAWWLYRTAYIMKMPSWSRRFRIVMDWTIDLFFPRDIVQLGLHRIEVGRQFVPVREPEAKAPDGPTTASQDAKVL
jgi:NADH:ubiquinone reductase (H+-translocating)